MQNCPIFGALNKPRSLSNALGYEHKPKFFKNLIWKKINFLFYGKETYPTIFIYGKMLVIEISNNFLYVWNCTELYGKSFFIFGNCMTKSFGQPV